MLCLPLQSVGEREGRRGDFLKNIYWLLGKPETGSKTSTKGLLPSSAQRFAPSSAQALLGTCKPFFPSVSRNYISIIFTQ